MRFAVAVVVVTAWVSVALAQPTGKITGTVVDEQGQPVAMARVSYENLDDPRILGMIVRYAETDVAGKFVFDRLDWGRYALYPQKIQDDYPDLRFAIYSGGTYQIATISAAQPIADITVKLGPKAGVLQGKVFSTADGRSISARAELRCRDHPARLMATSIPPDYSLLIPADTDVDLTFTAEGFQAYSTAIRMRSGQKLTLDVALTPVFPQDSPGASSPSASPAVEIVQVPPVAAFCL